VKENQLRESLAKLKLGVILLKPGSIALLPGAGVVVNLRVAIPRVFGRARE